MSIRTAIESPSQRITVKVTTRDGQKVVARIKTNRKDEPIVAAFLRHMGRYAENPDDVKEIMVVADLGD